MKECQDPLLASSQTLLKQSCRLMLLEQHYFIISEYISIFSLVS